MGKNFADLVAEARTVITECSVADVWNLADNERIMIDVREPEELNQGYIEGTINVPLGTLASDVGNAVDVLSARLHVDGARPAIILYCASGGRSALAARAMQEMGYADVRSMTGGIIAWSGAGLPIEFPD